MIGKTSGQNRLITATSTHTAGAASRVNRPERRKSAGYWATASSTLVILLAAINLAGCRPAHSQDDPRTWTPLVEIAMVRPADAPERAFTGVVVARVQSNLGFRVPGKVIQRLVNTGDFVRRGQALMQIDRNDLALAIAARDAAVASARARAIQTATDEGRYRSLLAAEVTSKQSYDQAKAAADAARAQLHQAEAEAHEARNEGGYSVLTADADGVVTDTLAEPGQVVAAGQTVVKLAHAGSREAAVYLPETIRPAIGSVVRATLYGKTESVAARLRQLSDSADPETRTYEARYVLEGLATQAPLGATVTIRLREAGTSEGLRVPIASIIDRGNGPGVWVYERANSAVSFEPVKIVRLDEENAYVKDGVEPGEEIVALGAHLLATGQHVRVAKKETASQ
jgi:RND family efflux transporter MFP subunit